MTSCVVIDWWAVWCLAAAPVLAAAAVLLVDRYA